MLTGCHVALILRERQKKKSLIISRWGFLSLSLMSEREECPNFINLKYVLRSPFFASSGCPPPSQKRKNEEEKHRMEVGYRELGLGGGGRWKSYCPRVHYKNQLRVFAFRSSFLMLWIGGGKNLMFIIILMKIKHVNSSHFGTIFTHHSLQDEKSQQAVHKKCQTAAWRPVCSFTIVLRSACETQTWLPAHWNSE